MGHRLALTFLVSTHSIMAPYKLETPFVEWFTCYEIGQRICPKVTLDERVFIAGGELARSVSSGHTVR